MVKITKIQGFKISDSAGNPTLKVEVLLDNGIRSFVSLPQGTSVGSYEARNVSPLQAIENIKKVISPFLSGQDVTLQAKIDQLLIDLDGMADKSRLGANAILGVSLGCARAASILQKIPLWQYIFNLLGERFSFQIPTPLFNLINGGRHARSKLSFQEFLVIPQKRDYPENFSLGKKVFILLKEVLKEKNITYGFGKEGGYTFSLKDNTKAIEILIQGIKKAGFILSKDCSLGLDIAASHLPSPISDYQLDSLIGRYPITFLEDPKDENDWIGWQNLTSLLKGKVTLVGDDLFATNPTRLGKGIRMRVANGIVIKPNQIGTLSETLKVSKEAKRAGYKTVLSHRSGETKDDFIADLAIGLGADFFKGGAPNPLFPERMVKYNRLEKIEQEINAK